MKNSKTWIGVAFCIIIGLVLLIPALKDYRNLKTAPDVSDLKEEDYKEDLMVRGHADMVFATYCAQYDDNDNEVFRWYLVPATDNTTPFYLGIKVNSKLFDSYNLIYDATWDYLEGKTDSLTKTISFQGRLKQVDGEVEKYLDKFIQENQTKPEYFARYYVELKTTKASFGLMIAGAVFIFVGILMIFLGKFNEKRYMEAASERHRIAQSPLANGFSLVLDERELERMSATNQVVSPVVPDYNVTNATPVETVSADPVIEPAAPEEPVSAADEAAGEAEKPVQDSDDNDIFVL